MLKLKQITVALLVATTAVVSQVTFADIISPPNSIGVPRIPEIVELERQIAELEKQRSEYSSEQKKVNEHLSLVKNDIAVTQKKLTTLKQEESSLNSQNASLTSKINTITSKIASLKARLAALYGKCQNNQYVVSGKCAACPANATCDGKTAKCKAGYNQATNKTTGEVVCKKATKKCQQGSHDSTAWIKAHYKNCTNCRKENIKAGACAKNKKAHVHYYCDCDC